MSPRRRWIDDRVDVLLAALDGLGMSTSRTAATALIQDRIEAVAAGMGIVPRHCPPVPDRRAHRRPRRSHGLLHR